MLQRLKSGWSRLGAAAASILATAGTALAQDTATTEIDLTAAENFAKDLSDKLVDFVNDHLIVAVVAVLAAIVGLLLAYRVIRWLIRALSGR